MRNGNPAITGTSPFFYLSYRKFFACTNFRAQKFLKRSLRTLEKPSFWRCFRRSVHVTRKFFRPITTRLYGLNVFSAKNFWFEILYGRICLPRNFLDWIFSGSKFQKPKKIPVES